MPSRQMVYLGTPVMTFLVAMVLLAPSASQSYAAAEVKYRTHLSLQCYTAGTGEGIFQLLKNGKAISTTTLTCGGYLGKSDAYPITDGKPLEWKVVLKLYDSSGKLTVEKTASGKGFPGSSSIAGSLFANIDSPARYY